MIMLPVWTRKWGFKYVDDRTVLEMEMFGTWLSEYNFKNHVASDIGIEEK